MKSIINKSSFLSMFDDHIDGKGNEQLQISRIDILLLFIFFFSSFLLKLVLYMQSDYANGSDGYVYIIQVKSIITEGRMHFRDSSLIYPYLALLSLVLKNYVLALKVGIAILSGLMAVSIYLLSHQITGRRWVSVALSLAVLFSPSITFLAAQFPKNFMALVFFFFFVYYCIKKNMAGILVFFFLSFITHRLMAGFSILFFCSLILFSMKSRYILISLCIVHFSGAILSLLLPGIIHIYDFERFKGLFTSIPGIAPVNFFNLMGVDKINLLWKAELILYYLLLIVYIGIIFYNFIKKRYASKYFSAIVFLLVITVFPFFTMDSTGMGYRFFLMFVPFSFPPLIYLVKDLGEINLKVSSLIMLILTILVFVSIDITRFDPPYKFYEKISQKTENFLKDKKVSLLVAHKPLAEMMDYTISREVLPWNPEDYFDKRTTWRIAHDIEIWEIRSVVEEITDDNVYQLSPRYIVINENNWYKFKNKINKEDNPDLFERVFSMKNPHLIRPAYLKR